MNKKPITFTYIKPGATLNSGGILRNLLFNDFQILAAKSFIFSEALAQEFYSEHKEKPFFEALWKFTISEPVLVMIMSHDWTEDIITLFRETIGSTDPNKAKCGTIREQYGDKIAYAKGIPANAIHGSDSHESALREIKLIFPEFNLTEYE